MKPKTSRPPHLRVPGKNKLNPKLVDGNKIYSCSVRKTKRWRCSALFPSQCQIFPAHFRQAGKLSLSLHLPLTALICHHLPLLSLPPAKLFSDHANDHSCFQHGRGSESDPRVIRLTPNSTFPTGPFSTHTCCLPRKASCAKKKKI